EAALRRGIREEEGMAPEEPMPDLATVLQRFGEEIEQLLGGGEGRRRAAKGAAAEESSPPAAAAAPGRPSLEEQRVDLDRRLRAELERQGLVVTGKEVARVVGQSVGKGIEWAG